VSEATITPKLDVIKVTHSSSKNNNNTKMSKKFLINRLPNYVREISIDVPNFSIPFIILLILFFQHLEKSGSGLLYHIL
jgi:hypothetical protein